MSITKEDTVAEVVSKNVGSDHVFSKYKIDFCCGGGDSLEKACKESGVSFETLKLEIESVKNNIVGDSRLDQLDLNSALKRTVDVHHKYFKTVIPELYPLASKVAEVHGKQHPEVVEINILLSKIISEITEQLAVEVNTLFPFVEKHIHEKEGGTLLEESVKDILKLSIRNIETSHSLVVDLFKTIANLSSNYSIPEGACNSFKLLYEKLNSFEHELHKYIHFEKNMLFPKLLKL